MRLPTFLSLRVLRVGGAHAARAFSSEATGDFRKATSEDGERVARIGAIKARKKTPRWYQFSEVIENKDGKYEIALDGRRLQTPNDHRLRVPFLYLANGIAFEWMRQPEKIRPSTMPLMQHSCTAIDRLPMTRNMVISMILEHLHTDTACCRSEREWNPELYDAQKQLHDPLIRWFCEHFRVHLDVMNTAIGGEQPTDTITVLQWYLHRLDDWTLAGLDVMVQCLRSTVIAMAVYHGKISVAEGLKASRLEENAQQEEWGYVEGAHDIHEADLSLRLHGAAFYLQSLK